MTARLPGRIRARRELGMRHRARLPKIRPGLARNLMKPRVTMQPIRAQDIRRPDGDIGVGNHLAAGAGARANASPPRWRSRWHPPADAARLANRGTSIDDATAFRGIVAAAGPRNSVLRRWQGQGLYRPAGFPLLEARAAIRLAEWLLWPRVQAFPRGYAEDRFAVRPSPRREGSSDRWAFRKTQTFTTCC